MSTTIITKHSNSAKDPQPSDIERAEIAIDLQRRKIFTKDNADQVIELGGSPDADNYGHWKLQVDYGQPYEVVSGATANFEGTNGIKVTRTGDTITIDGSELDLDEEADNYQYWTYKVDGFSTTNVMSTQVLDFQSGDGIDITKEGYGIKISATGGGGGGEFVHIGANPPASPEEGQQWMEVPASGDAVMWIYDGDKWLQHPSGKDGAPGADGNIADATEQGVIATWDNTSQQWTPEGAVVVDASGNVGIGANNAVTTGLSLSGDYNLSWQEASGTSICNAFRQTQTGNLVLAAGYKWSPTAGGFTSSQGGEFSRTAVSIGASVKFYADQAVNVPEGTDFTPTERMEIDASGRVIVPNGSGYYSNRTSGNVTLKMLGYVPGTDNVELVTSDQFFINDTGGNTKVGVNITTGRVDITGSLYVNGNPKIGTAELIETLHTLREATKDESTIEGLRDSISNAVGGLIEKFEAMQSTATQEIADE